jgi:hypothetical protein
MIIMIISKLFIVDKLAVWTVVFASATSAQRVAPKFVTILVTKKLDERP